MTPFDIFLTVIGSISTLAGLFTDAKDDERTKRFLGGMIVFGIILIGIAMWRIS